VEGRDLAEGAPQGSTPEGVGVPEAEQRDPGAAAGGANGEAGAGGGVGVGVGAGGERQGVRNKEKVLVLSSRGIVYR